MTEERHKPDYEAMHALEWAMTRAGMLHSLEEYGADLEDLMDRFALFSLLVAQGDMTREQFVDKVEKTITIYQAPKDQDGSDS